MPARRVRMPPAHLQGEAFSVSAVIGFDLNLNFLVRPVAKAGGVRAIPSDDWQEIERLLTPSVAWPAVIAGVPVIRSTTHRISAVFDAAGRLLTKASSFDGRVVLVKDIPIEMRSTQ